MKNQALLLATLCIFAHATSVFQAPAFLEIKKTAFGNSVASLVELNMSHAGRLDAIAEVLNTIEVTLHERSDHNDAEISRERGWCADQRASLTEQINNASANLHSLEEEQANLTTEEAELTATLVGERQDLSTNEANLVSTNAELDAENERYANAAKDYAEAIAACEQGLSLLATLRTNPAGFVQTKARFGNVVALLQKHLSNKSSSFVQPVLTVLTELATSTSELDQGKLSKVVSLIEELLSELRNQQSQNEQRHKESVENLSAQIAGLETVIADIKASIERHEARHAQVVERLAQLVGLIEEVSAFLAAVQETLRQTNETCDGYEQQYSSVSVEIGQQIATLEELKAYFKAQVVPSVEGVRDSSYEDTLTVKV